jgi:hypothetical protein
LIVAFSLVGSTIGGVVWGDALRQAQGSMLASQLRVIGVSVYPNFIDLLES